MAGGYECTACGGPVELLCRYCDTTDLRRDLEEAEKRERHLGVLLQDAFNWASKRPAGVHPTSLRWWLDARALLKEAGDDGSR